MLPTFPTLPCHPPLHRDTALWHTVISSNKLDVESGHDPSPCDTITALFSIVISVLGVFCTMAVFVSHEREKLINAILFFAHNTEHLGKIKLFKLLYLLDFEHFRQTGKSVTGLYYSAWKFGPVPQKVMEEWEEPEADIARAITIQPERVIDYERQTVVPNESFDDTHFTKRELRLMTELAARYRHTASPDMIDVTHAENGAWAKVWQSGQGAYQQIPYALSLEEDAPNKDAILAKASEYQATRASHSTRTH